MGLNFYIKIMPKYYWRFLIKLKSRKGSESRGFQSLDLIPRFKKNSQLDTHVFQLSSQEYRRFFKTLLSFLLSNQIWRNLHRNGRHFR
jgi:hypothetical protein